MAIKITLICPVYKVAEFIPELMDSLVAGVNTENVEVIFVDDCCPENSINLCEDFLAKNKSIIKFSTTIIKQPINKGQAAARNAALIVANGTYIGFIDSDDAIAPNYWEALSTHVGSAANDIIEFDFKEFTTLLPTPDWGKYRDVELVKTDLFKSGFFVWTRLYKKNILDKCRFPEGVIYEDIYFNIQAFSHASSIVKIPKTLVFYRKRLGSTTSKRTSSYSNLLLNMVNSVKESIDKFDDKKTVVAQVARYSLLVSLKGYSIEDKKDRKLFFKQCRNINSIFKSIFKEYNKSIVAKLKFNLSNIICINGKR
ncbi:glycosyltransferase family 2 protein [Pseudoalteromonas sp. Angola-18]|uniref:glycosyltransferase family 2 protein n=1 Tax=Pseudoalteromonas sp. Angola-18 TaxID=3025338 RepID=UPI00235902FF|nr:glycosyltransferase family 2 protein [Pseudoalteromonas sp. Angola-18]MDC9500779.1 glycosyltransferase family 2 protein [Pseudoalteromonas sp. Angola-18]